MTTIDCAETTFKDRSNNFNPYLGTGKVVSGMYLDNKINVAHGHMTEPGTHLENKHLLTHVDEPVISDRPTPNEVVTVTPSFSIIRPDELTQRKGQVYMHDDKGRSQQNNQRSSDYGNMTNNCDKTNTRQKAELNTIVVLESKDTGCSGNDEHVRMIGRGIKALTVTENTLTGTEPTDGEPENCHNAENPCVVGETTSTNINYPEGLGNNAMGTPKGCDPTRITREISGHTTLRDTEESRRKFCANPNITNRIESHSRRSDELIQVPKKILKFTIVQSQESEIGSEAAHILPQEHKAAYRQCILTKAEPNLVVSDHTLQTLSAQNEYTHPQQSTLDTLIQEYKDTTDDPDLGTLHHDNVRVDQHEGVLGHQAPEREISTPIDSERKQSDDGKCVNQTHELIDIQTSQNDHTQNKGTATPNFAEHDLTLKHNTEPMSFLHQDSAPLTHPFRNISIQGHINGRPVTYLVDTGANVSAIRAEVWRQIPQMTKHPPTPTHVTKISAVNGQSIPVLGQVELPLSINDRVYPFHVLVIETIAYDVILGRDFLEFYKAKINLQEHVLELQRDTSPQEPFPFAKLPTQGDPTICSIHAQTSFIIPPHTEVLVAGELGDHHQVGETGLVFPQGDLPTRYNILGAAQIVKTWE